MNCDAGENGAKHNASQRYRCDAKEALSSTLLFTYCSCWDSYRLYKSFFPCQKSLNSISAQSAYCKLQARTAKHSVLSGSSLNCFDKFLSMHTCMFIVCILNLFSLTAVNWTCFPHWQSLHDHPPHLGILNTFCCLLGHGCGGRRGRTGPQVKHHYLGHGFHGGHRRDKRLEHVFLMQTALI